MPQATTPVVTMKGNPVTLIGGPLEVGKPAPEGALVANDLSEFRLSSLKGKKVIISVVPSLDTPVCDLQTKRFNQEAEKLGKDVTILTVSRDLPFAQKRWCAATGSDQVKTLSDFRDGSFGKTYGVLIDGLKLLARAIFIIDADGILRYKQIVSEITKEPNYDDVLNAVKKL
jgi:thiol peroxidase